MLHSVQIPHVRQLLVQKKNNNNNNKKKKKKKKKKQQQQQKHEGTWVLGFSAAFPRLINANIFPQK